MEKERILQFNESVLSVLNIFDSTFENDPEFAGVRASTQDWPTIQAALRSVAEELMIAPSVDEAMRLLKRDPASALTAVLAAKRLGPEVASRAIRRAFAKAPSDFSNLPCLPMAVFLIEICDSLQFVKPE